MSFFDDDKEKIKDMEYDPKRGRYIGKDGSEFRSTPYKNGSGYKYDFYESSTYGNAKHNGKHVQSDLNENWECTENDRDNGTQKKSSGRGCYLTSACMAYYLTNFDDNCYELTMMRWLRDNVVSEADVKHYYQVAPTIVESIEKEENKDIIYNYIYDNVLDKCVEAIENGEYMIAYKIYKNNIAQLEDYYLTTKGKTRTLKQHN